MRNEDASQAGLNESNAVNARDDADHLAAKDFGPATGNLISGAGTINGAAGTDLGGSDARIVAIEGSGGSDSTFSAGKLEVAGQYGTLTIDAEGNYSYVRNAGTPAGVSDVFTYTLQGQGGASDTARLIINIGDVPMLATDGTRVVPGPDGTVVLPAGVELSDVRVVGRDLVVTLPDGSTMVIVDGAIFVPQLVLDGVEVPASNLAALLIGAEPTPAAGDFSPQQQSSGGNFALPPPPLDPGVPLGDLLPPTVLDYTPPDLEEINNAVDRDPVAGIAAIQLDDDDVPGKNGNAGGPNDDAGSPNATGGGFLPGSEGDGSLAWALLSSGAPSGFTYNLQPDGSIQVVQVQGGSNVIVLTISVNPVTGAYTVTENNPVRHATGDTENNSTFVVTYSVTDDDGDVALGTLTINVDDDTPTVTVSAGSDANVVLTTDDAQTIGAASDTAASLADFSGVFGATAVSAGADGLGAGSSSSYTLNITGPASGLFSHGSAINLFMLNGVVVGTTGGQPASLADANIVFTVSVSGTGVVTLTQLQQIDHPIASDPTASGAPFADHIVSMADGLVTLTRSETAVDNDGDSVTGSASVNIGANLRFTDDGPTVSGAQLNSSVTVDETDGAEPVSSGAPIIATSAAAIIVGGGVNYGADGEGLPPTYGLSLVNGSAIGTSIDSGLVTAVGDHVITLTLTSATLITATYQDGGTQTAFTIQMNTNGTVTVTQYTALEHGVDGPPGPAHDDALNLIDGEINLVNATVTYRDFDGDTATATAAIGGAITFRDDGPSVTITAGSDAEIALVTSDDGTEGAGSTSDSTSAAFDGAFSITGSNGGGDGTASTSSLSFALSTAGGDSGLTSHGDAIILYMVGTTVVGSTGAQPADLSDANIVFTVSVSGTGIVTLTQLQQIDHPIVDDPDATDAPFSDHTISMLDDSLITLTATATITDNDGDTATDSESIDIAANLVFQDDGPTIDASLKQGASLHIDESLPGVDNAPEETDAVGLGQVTKALSDLITVTESPASADQPTTISGGTLSLGPAGGNGLVASGLMTSAGDLPIYLYNVGGVIFGSTALVAPVAVDANTVFTVAIVGGNVVMTQYQAVEHPTPGASHDENVGPLNSGALLLSVTGTDFDGDTDSDTVDLGSIITFGDDGPSVSPTANIEPNLTVDESNLGIDAGPTSFAGLFNVDFGSDGPAATGSLDFELNINQGSTGLVDTATGEDIILVKVGDTVEGRTETSNLLSFVISVNADGEVSFDQRRAVVHDDENDPNDVEIMDADSLITLSVTATDADGDTGGGATVFNIAQNFRFLDDGPTITPPVTDPLNIDNDASPSGKGNFLYSVGADTNSDFDDISVSTVGVNGFNVSINGTPVPLADITLIANADATGVPGSAPETANTASYYFEFDYSTGPGGTATATGTLVFYKTGPDAGKYEVTLTSGPIQGFTLADTGSAGVDAFDPYDAPGQAGGSPEIQNVQVADNLFIQFTSGSVPNNGTFQTGDFVSIDPDPAAEVPPDPNQQWVEGDLFIDNNATFGTVTASSAAIGANSNTLQNEEVIEFNLYASDPGGVPNTDPTTSAGEMFVRFDLISDVDDLVVILKLVDTVTGEFTTKAIIVDAADLYRGNSAADEAFLAGTIYSDFSNMGNNEALLIIQENDYNAAGEHWQIVGGQILTGETSVSGTGINLVRGLGAAGGSSAAQAFNTDTDTGSAKIMSIGFLVPETSAQQATIEFDVTVTDGDGDSVTQNNVTVNIGTPPPPPIVLDMDGDGAEFLGLNSGVHYDYGAGLVATAWVGADDAILVRDVNGDGTVTDASEFVFGGNGVTDMEALHAQYGEQLDASDADFTMFALWTDANSNGVVDSGEMQSLAEAGIVSIGLVSDGASYTAANGDVSVAGNSTYTLADGSTGTAADAAFAIGGTARNQEVERVAANSNTTVLAAAVAAAGMAASAAASTGDTTEATLSNAVVSVEPLSVTADLASSASVAVLAASFTDAAATVSVSLGDQAMLAPAWHASAGDIGQSEGFEAAFSALATGTDVIASQMTMPTMATTVAMPSAEALSALENSPAATIDTVEQILVDALAGGGINQIDALMNALPDTGNGGIPLIDSAASGLHGLVPSWDMGGDAGFTPAVPTIITTEAMMLHVDAIQPAANG